MKDDVIFRNDVRKAVEAELWLSDSTKAAFRNILIHVPAVDAETVFEAVGLVKEAFEMAKADLVPVVRCRDCVNWAGDPAKKPEYAGCWRYGAAYGIIVHENGFCDKGMRRTGL